MVGIPSRSQIELFHCPTSTARHIPHSLIIPAVFNSGVFVFIETMFAHCFTRQGKNTIGLFTMNAELHSVNDLFIKFTPMNQKRKKRFSHIRRFSTDVNRLKKSGVRVKLNCIARTPFDRFQLRPSPGQSQARRTPEQRPGQPREPGQESREP